MNGRVINFLAGPGVGKTSTTAALFAELKYRNHNVEAAWEYAKELAWQDNPTFDQNEIFRVQSQRIAVARKTELVITDGPLLMQTTYLTDADAKLYPKIVMEYHKYDNLNIVLKRSSTKPYNPNGRYQTEEQAKEKDGEIEKMLEEFSVPYITMEFGRGNVGTIIELLKERGWI
ncbi:AAA family ATPase [Ralstonia phage RP13]|nr:AAA family ATPase [Ralstonia phage RP13]